MVEVVIDRGRMRFVGPGLPASEGDAFVRAVLEETERALDARLDLPPVPIVIPRLAIELVIERDARVSLAVLLGRALADRIVREVSRAPDTTAPASPTDSAALAAVALSEERVRRLSSAARAAREGVAPEEIALRWMVSESAAPAEDADLLGALLEADRPLRLLARIARSARFSILLELERARAIEAVSERLIAELEARLLAIGGSNATVAKHEDASIADALWAIAEARATEHLRSLVARSGARSLAESAPLFALSTVAWLSRSGSPILLGSSARTRTVIVRLRQARGIAERAGDPRATGSSGAIDRADAGAIVSEEVSVPAPAPAVEIDRRAAPIVERSAGSNRAIEREERESRSEEPSLDPEADRILTNAAGLAFLMGLVVDRHPGSDPIEALLLFEKLADQCAVATDDPAIWLLAGFAAAPEPEELEAMREREGSDELTALASEIIAEAESRLDTIEDLGGEVIRLAGALRLEEDRLEIHLAYPRSYEALLFAGLLRDFPTIPWFEDRGLALIFHRDGGSPWITTS